MSVKRGRPSLGSAAKRHPLSSRTTEAMRERLERAAEKSGRSLAQEIEWRLERSFLMDDVTAFLKSEIAAR